MSRRDHNRGNNRERRRSPPLIQLDDEEVRIAFINPNRRYQTFADMDTTRDNTRDDPDWSVHATAPTWHYRSMREPPRRHDRQQSENSSQNRVRSQPRSSMTDSERERAYSIIADNREDRTEAEANLARRLYFEANDNNEVVITRRRLDPNTVQTFGLLEGLKWCEFCRSYVPQVERRSCGHRTCERCENRHEGCN